MPKTLALSWDDQTLRLMHANVVRDPETAENVRVQHCQVLSIGDQDVEELLKKWVQEHRFEGAQSVIPLGRGEVEMRILDLPPVPSDELPDIVRMQAQRQMSTAAQSAAVDYVVVSKQDDAIRVLATACQPKTIQKRLEIIRRAGLEPSGLTFRPLASASCHAASTGDETLLIRGAGEFDLLVIRGGRPVSVRTVRSPVQDDVSRLAEVLIGEVNRSRMASGCEIGIACPTILMGDPAVEQALADALAAKGATVRVEPLNGLPADAFKQPSDAPEVSTASLAALLGSLRGGPLNVDFLNPRRAPEVAPNRIKQAVMVAIPLLLVLGGYLFVRTSLGSRDQKIADLDRQIADTQPDVDAASQAIAETERVDKFLDANVNWLEELQLLSEKLPPSDQLILSDFGAQSKPSSGGGTITLRGKVNSPEALEVLAESISDEAHMVSSDGRDELQTDDAYRWSFTEKISVDPMAVRQIRNERLRTFVSAQDNANATPETDPADVADAEGVADEAPAEIESGGESPEEMMQLLETAAEQLDGESEQVDGESKQDGESKKDDESKQDEVSA